MSRNQLNVRVTPEIESVIDAKRIELAKARGAIPTRSDIVRFALEAYLGVSLDAAGERASVAAKARKRSAGHR